MNNIVIVPSLIAFTAIVVQIVSLWFSIYVTRQIGLEKLNGFNISISIALVRRILDYLTTFHSLSNFAPSIRYAELAYFPIAFSIFIIIGFIQIKNKYIVDKIKH